MRFLFSSLVPWNLCDLDRTQMIDLNPDQYEDLYGQDFEVLPTYDGLSILRTSHTYR